LTLAQPAHAAGPYERGPDPTDALLEASRGPFSTSEERVSSLVRGFGGGRVYYPDDTSQGTFGAIAISPGYTASWSTPAWLGPRPAPLGAAAIGLRTHTPTAPT